MDVVPKQEEEKMILEEIRDHAAYWKSDRCKLATVIAHLNGSTVCHPSRLGIPDVEAKIQWLVAVNVLEVMPSRSGEYVRIRTSKREVSA